MRGGRGEEGEREEDEVARRRVMSPFITTLIDNQRSINNLSKKKTPEKKSIKYNK